MNTYHVLTRISGLCRADGGKKVPIEPQAVIALPDAIAEGLLRIRAIEPSDAEPTVELIWLDDEGAAAARDGVRSPDWGHHSVRRDDREALAEALEALGASVLFPDDLAELKLGEATGVALVAVNDRSGLVEALRALDAEVVFPGEPLGRFAEKLSNAELASELADRIKSGRLPRHELPEIVAVPHLAPAASPPAEPAAKPARKAKAVAK